MGATPDDIAELTAAVNRLQQEVRGQTGPPDVAWYSYEDACIRLHQGIHPGTLSDEEYDRALRRARNAGITPNFVKTRANGDCKWLYVVRAGKTKFSAPLIPEEAIRSFESALEGDVVKARNRP